MSLSLCFDKVFRENLEVFLWPSGRTPSEGQRGYTVFAGLCSICLDRAGRGGGKGGGGAATAWVTLG